MTNAEAISNDARAPESSTAQTLWRIAVSEHEKAKALLASIEDEHSAAEAAYFDRIRIAKPEEFRDYQLDHYAQFHRNEPDSRKGFIRSIELMVAMNDIRLSDGERLSAEQVAAITAKATQLVDDYLAFQNIVAAEREAAQADYGPIEAKWSEALDRVCDTRKALLETPAPDTDAMLYKLELLAAYLKEGDDEDADSVAILRDDAARLLGRA